MIFFVIIKKSAARSNGFLRFYTLMADLRQMQTLDIFAQIKNRRKCVIFGWSSWIRTSGMTESKSVALPLGYTPKNGKKKWGEWWGSNPRITEPQSAVLATSPHPPHQAVTGFPHMTNLILAYEKDFVKYFPKSFSLSGWRRIFILFYFVSAASAALRTICHTSLKGRPAACASVFTDSYSG